MYNDDILLSYLEEYYKKHGKITDITSDHIANYKNQQLHVGRMLSSIRNNHRSYIAGINNKNGSHSKRSIKRYQFLDEHNFIWNPEEEKISEDVFLKYLEEHYKKYGTLNNIKQNDTVVYNGEILNIGNILTKVRMNHKSYIEGAKNEHGSHSDLSLKRYKFLDEHDFIWENQEDLYIDFLQEYYKKHQTLKDINIDDVIIYKGEELRIKDFINHIRANHKSYVNGINNKNGSHSEQNIKRYKILDELDFIWEPEKEKRKNDIFLEFLEDYYKEHGTINAIPTDEAIEYKNQQLNIKDFFTHVRKNYRSYKAGIDNKNGSHSELSLKRYKFLNEHDFIWEPTKERKQTINSEALKIGVAHSTLKRYIEIFEGDISKAIKICQENKKLRDSKTNTKQDYNLENILTMFDIDIDTLKKLLNRSSIKIKKENSTLMHSEQQSLREFCITNGYNYDVIYRAVKLKTLGLCNENIESLINRTIIDYRNNGQNKPSTWVYSKYGNEVLLKHFLLGIHLDYTNILMDMSKNCITLEEAIENESFKKNTPQEFSYLEPLYHNFIKNYNEYLETHNNKNSIGDEVKQIMLSIIKEYNLTQEEYNTLYESFNQYLNSIYTYHLLDVGFEKDEKKKVEKIIAYNFDEDDIEEAYFSPLQFDEKVLLGRDSVISKRRNLIKNLTVGWSNLTEEEKQYKIDSYNLTDEEQYYITSSRKKIDNIKENIPKK